MKYTKESIDSIRKRLDEAPAPELPRSLLATIEELLPTINGMKKRRFKLENIASLLTESGVAISEDTLKNYIQRISRRATAATPPKPSEKKSRTPRKSRAVAAARAATQANAAPQPAAVQTSTFQPRLDSNDI